MKSENNKNDREKIVSNKFIKWILIILGSVSVVLGIIGIILPVLPTTPFLLLAAALFARSSTKFYQWLITNKWFGKYIKNYREGKGLPTTIKISSILILWITIIISVIFFMKLWWVRLILILIAIAASIYILLLPSDSKGINT